jgi:hypothetical protein
LLAGENQGGDRLARTNFKFAKRQKELERKKKKDEKLKRKLEKKGTPAELPGDEVAPGAGEESSAPEPDPDEVR